MEKNQFELMKENGWVSCLQAGRIVFNREFYRVMQMFDTIIMKWADEDEAIEMFYPDFYRIEDLEKCNYIQQFHSHCYFAVSSISDNFDENIWRQTGFVNNSAICMHSYIQYQNTVLEPDHPLVITAKGKCKRNEKSGYHTLERLSDFTMREIIFIGSANYVLAKRKSYMEKAKQLMDSLQLEGNIAASNDPFFRKEDEKKITFQKKFKLKYELSLKNADNGHEIAVASFNYHNVNFSKPFHIYQEDNSLAHTGCMAFGLERLAFAYLTQVGFEKYCSTNKDKEKPETYESTCNYTGI